MVALAKNGFLITKRTCSLSNNYIYQKELFALIKVLE